MTSVLTPPRPASRPIGARGPLATIVLLLGVSLVLALETPSKLFLDKNSFYLSSAGFRVQLANDAAGKKALRALPPHQFITARYQWPGALFLRRAAALQLRVRGHAASLRLLPQHAEPAIVAGRQHLAGLPLAGLDLAELDAVGVSDVAGPGLSAGIFPRVLLSAGSCLGAL